jgi:fructuronate reductase
MKMLHVGLGNFHKAHQAWYVQRLNDLAGEHWEISAFSMQKPDAALELARANFSYDVLAVQDGRREELRVKSITQAGFLGSDQALLKELARDPEMTLITVTVTEKGYAPNAPLLLALDLILRERRTPVSIVSCDNLQANGKKLEALVRAHMDASFPAFPVSFPCSMVDRIVPASRPGEAIKTELFCQWVIEDAFVAPRPAFENVGVQFVSDVTPFELMKLRLLNAAHSFLAYWGLNRGFEFVHQVIADIEGRRQLEALFAEIIPLLDLPAGLDPHAYVQKLLARFNNPDLPHRLAQIACDGSVKLPQRIVPSLQVALAQGRPHVLLEQTLAEWTRAMVQLPDELFSDPLRLVKDETELRRRVGVP